MPKTKKLTDRQKRFALEYLTDSNATQAAIRAGYSEKTAYSIGQRLLKNVEVRLEIERRTEKLEKKIEVNQERVLRELALLAFSRVTDFLEVKDGKVVIKDTADIDPDSIAAIAGIKQGPHGLELKLHGKEKSLELLARILRLFDTGNPANDETIVFVDSEEAMRKYLEEHGDEHGG